MRRRALSAARAVAAVMAIGLTLAIQPSGARADALAIDGHVVHPQSLSAAELAKLPTTSVAVSFQTGQGEEHGRYDGVLLWTLLQRAGLADTEGKRADLHHTVTVVGTDGYAVAIAFGEVDPDFEGKQVIIAYRRDGRPLDAREGLRLIVPGDKHGGRDVRDVARITVN